MLKVATYCYYDYEKMSLLIDVKIDLLLKAAGFDNSKC